MPAVGLIALAGLVVKFTDFLKSLTNKDWNATVTQLVAWGGGIAAVFLASATIWAKGKGFDIGGVQLNDLDGWSKLYAGLSAASVGGVAFDFKKSFDNKDSAVQPPLMPGTPTNNDPNN